MTLPTNGITADIIRDIMPPYQLNTDLLTAMLAAVPPPLPDATTAWRQARAARLVQEFAGLMPADAPQARIAAEIVIVRKAIEDTLARANVPGLAIEQVCRLRRTASALLASVAALERSLVRHQQKPVPFFRTVLADGIDVAALAAECGGARAPRDGGEALGGEATTAPRPELRQQAGPDDAAAGEAAIGEIVQGPYGTGDGAGTGAAGALTLDASRLDLGPLFAAHAREERESKVPPLQSSPPEQLPGPRDRIARQGSEDGAQSS